MIANLLPESQLLLYERRVAHIQKHIIIVDIVADFIIRKIEQFIAVIAHIVVSNIQHKVFKAT